MCIHISFVNCNIVKMDCQVVAEECCFSQAIPGIPKIEHGYNPATWMLDVTNLDQEMELGVDFADLYVKSQLYR